MTKDEAMRLALDALVNWDARSRLRVVEALRAALTQPEQDLRRKRRLEKVQDAICANLMSVNSNSVESQPIKTQPEPEPVAWMRVEDLKAFQESGYTESASVLSKPFGSCDSAPLYAAPPQRKPLAGEEIDALILPTSGCGTVQDFVRVIEAAHGIKD